jgi:hypothetical protein
MSSRKLRKKDFEEMLNEKGRRLAYAHVDLAGMDEYFEVWKLYGAQYPGFGTYLRRQHIPEFKSRYSFWQDSQMFKERGL